MNKLGGAHEYDRNNTNFHSSIFEHFKGAQFDKKYGFLKYYQNVVREYMTLDTGAKGLLVYHGMGLGKSIIAITLAIDMLNTRDPIILLTKSLVDNMRKTIDKYIEIRAEHDRTFNGDGIKDRFSFVSMNSSNMITLLKRAASRNDGEFDDLIEENMNTISKIPNLNNKVIIVDEAHNLFRAISNGSQSGVDFYDAVMGAKNLKIIFLTGTPLANDPFESVPCFNMLAGESVLPEEYTEFIKLFCPNDEVINKHIFVNRINGLVSYIGYESVPGKAFGFADSTTVEMPEEKPLIVERVVMGNEQIVDYLLARENEKDEVDPAKNWSSNGGRLSKPKGASSTYRVKSRQLSNFHKSANGSNKFIAILKNIQKHEKQLGLVYSQFVNDGGLARFALFLESNGYRRITAFTGGGEITAGGPTYALISSDIPIEVRAKIQDVYSSNANKYGGIIDLLLISSTGAEGLDLKNVRHIHIMEPYWTWGRILQIIARGVRWKSHINLPEHERNVQPYIYLAVLPNNETTTDVDLFDRAKKNQILINKFTQCIKEAAIECNINGEQYCVKCAPNSQKLFSDDILNDIKKDNPCKIIKTDQIRVNKITYDGIDYHWSDDPDSLYDIAIYDYDQKANIFRRMRESNPLFNKIMENIKK